jgi:hypothetical protein
VMGLFDLDSRLPCRIRQELPRMSPMGQRLTAEVDRELIGVS